MTSKTTKTTPKERLAAGLKQSKSQRFLMLVGEFVNASCTGVLPWRGDEYCTNGKLVIGLKEESLLGLMKRP